MATERAKAARPPVIEPLLGLDSLGDGRSGLGADLLADNDA